MAAAAAAMLTACGAPTETPTATPQATAPLPEPVNAPTRAIGTTSALTGQTSALTGVISDFLVERTAFGTRVQLAADTLFDFDQATLTPAAQTNLARAADLVRAGGSGVVTVTGYTDAKGEDGYNLALSRRRAEAVIAWLRQQPGLATRSFTPVGKGEADPVAPNAAADGSDDPAGRAKNRRVVLDIPK